MQYIYILLLNVFIIGCSSVPKEYLINDDICDYSDPFFETTTADLTIAQDLLKDLKTKKNDTIIVNTKSFKNEYWYSENESLRNLQTNKLKNILKITGYNHNGKIKWVEFIYLNGYKKILKESDYNEQGIVTKVINHEKGYNICWAEAIEIVKKTAKKDIEKYQVTGYNIRRVDLNEFPNEKPKWGISLDANDDYELKDTKVYWIDGVTGKFLRTTKITTTYKD